MKHVYILITGVGVGWLVGMSTSPVVGTVVSALLALVVSIVSIMAGVKNHPNEENGGPIGKTGALGALFRTKLDPLPIMILVIGIVGGAAFGNYMRANDMLSRDKEISKSVLGTGLKTHEGGLFMAFNGKDSTIGLPLEAMIQKYAPYIDTATIVQRVFDLDLPEANSPAVEAALERLKPQPEDNPIDHRIVHHSSNSMTTGLISTKPALPCDEMCAALDEELPGIFQRRALHDAYAREIYERTQDPKELRKEVENSCPCD